MTLTPNTHLFTHTHKNAKKFANSLATARPLHAPGRARMPIHQSGTMSLASKSRASKSPGAGLGTCRRKAFPHNKWYRHPKSTWTIAVS